MQTKRKKSVCVIEWDAPAPNWAGARTGGNLSVLDAPSPSVLDGAVGSAAREDARALYDARCRPMVYQRISAPALALTLEEERRSIRRVV